MNCQFLKKISSNKSIFISYFHKDFFDSDYSLRNYKNYQKIQLSLFFITFILKSAAAVPLEVTNESMIIEVFINQLFNSLS